MDREPGTPAAASARKGHVDGRPIGLAQIPEHRGITVTQQSTLAAGEHGSHPVALSADGSDGIHASVYATEPAIGQAAVARSR